jgi:predicted HicB family RNase H-like nuclease
MEKPRARKRAKSQHGKYGERNQRIQGEVSQEAKEGLQKMAAEAGVSLNELFERLGRGHFSLASSSGECCPN